VLLEYPFRRSHHLPSMDWIFGRRFPIILTLQTFFLMSFHSCWWIVQWALQGKLLRELSSMMVIHGVVAWAISIVVVVTAYWYVRRKKFELFYYIHFSSLIFLVFCCLHR